MKKLYCLLSYLFFAVVTPVYCGTFTEHHYIYCGAVLKLGPVGYPGLVEAKVLQTPAHGAVFIFTTPPLPDSLVYKSNFGYLGQDTFVVECAHATQIICDTGIYIISVIGCPPIVSFTDTFHIDCDSTLFVGGLGYPTWVTPVILQLPAHGTALLFQDSSLWYTMAYTPETGFTGTDTVVVECAHATQLTCETGIFIIHVDCQSNTGEQLPPELTIAPNPAGAYLRVVSEQPLERLLLLDVYGALLWKSIPGLQVKEFEIDMEDLPAGIYFLEIRNKGVQTLRKIVRQ